MRLIELIVTLQELHEKNRKRNEATKEAYEKLFPEHKNTPTGESFTHVITQQIDNCFRLIACLIGLRKQLNQF